MNLFQRKVKAALGLQKAVQGVERGTARRNGSFVYRRSYFYRPKSLEAWGQDVQQKLVDAGISASVELNDIFRHWPRDSYLEAVITPGENHDERRIHGETPNNG